jgi:hypothetical protein
MPYTSRLAGRCIKSDRLNDGPKGKTEKKGAVERRGAEARKL